jgi:hypothetical protein
MSYFDETWIFSTNLRKSADIKFHENPSSGRQDTIMHLHSSYKVLVYVIFWWNLNFLDKSSKILISNFMKIRLVVGRLFPADGRAAMTNPIDAFRNFANAPNTWNAGCVGICWGKGENIEDKKEITGRAKCERIWLSVDATVTTG